MFLRTCKLCLAAVVSLFVCLPAFGKARIQQELLDLMNKDTKAPRAILLILRQDLDVFKMQRDEKVHLLGRREMKKQTMELLRNYTTDFLNPIWGFVEDFEKRQLIQNAHRFWVTNAVSAIATPDAIDYLATHGDKQIDSIILDPDIELINPIQADVEAQNGLWGLDHIHAKEAAQKYPIERPVRVAVIDTGIRMGAHEGFREGLFNFDLSRSFVSSEDSVDDGNGHGTHVAGTIGSHLYGVAQGPGLEIVGVKVLNRGGSGTWGGVARGVEYGSEVADVLSMSLGGRASSNGNQVEEVVKRAIAVGDMLVIAAGNSGPSGRTIGTPGVVKMAITVGAIDSSGTIARFSSRGPSVYGDEKPEIVAPGVGVKSAWIGSDTATNTISGTSMATPHVSGLVAMIVSKNPDLKPDQVKAILMQTAFGQSEPNVYGAGTIHCVGALEGTQILVE